MSNPSLTADASAERVLTFSQASLQDYLDCPRRFELRYLQEMPWPAVEAEPLPQVESRQREALLFHRLVQQYYLGMPAAALEALANSPDLARWWRNFSTGAPELDGWELHTEKSLVCRIGSHRLVCKFDLLAIQAGKALIYDWKTFARRPKNEWLAARMQTRVYRTVLARAGAELNAGRAFAPNGISMIYWFADYPADPAKLDFGDAQYRADWQMLEGLVREIAAASDFPLTSDLQRCRFCTYRSLCDRGETAGTDMEFEPEPVDVSVSGLELEQIGEVGI